MEDHTETCRLAVTAAFVRGMKNFRTMPARRAIDGDVTVYHAMPHGLLGPLRERIVPDAFVDTTSVHAIKHQALAAHRSQHEFLADTQHMSSYLCDDGRHVARDGTDVRRIRTCRGVAAAPASRALWA